MCSLKACLKQTNESKQTKTLNALYCLSLVGGGVQFVEVTEIPCVLLHLQSQQHGVFF